MTEIIAYSGQLTVVTCWCGCKHAVPKEMHDHQLREHERGIDYVLHCPHGHAYGQAGKTEADRLREQLRAEQDRTQRALASNDQLLAEVRNNKQRISAQKAVTTRIKNRVQKGVCPCCNRHFANLQRHMETKHSEAKGNA